jgi:predicted NBD/HSP70 family sugar kinase
MYLGIDVGGTKTLVAVLNRHGVIEERTKFPTPPDYAAWRDQLARVVEKFSTKKFIAVGVGVPGRVDRARGIGLDMGNLPWHHVPVKSDLEKFLGCPVVVDNDANLAGLSEAMLVKHYSRVLYITISTGIGTGFIVDQRIEPAFADSEGGKMMLEHGSKVEEWEDFASGHAIFERYHMPARDITDPAIWKRIARDISIGMIDLIAVMQPQIIVLGGSIGTYYPRYQKFLEQALAHFETPLVPIPPIKQASRPEEAVVYGCYDLAKSVYGSARK